MKMTADEAIKAVSSLVPANRTASVNGTGIDCRGFGEALIVLNIGAFTSGDLDVKIQESSDDGVGDTFADITGAVFTQKGTTDANKVFVGRVAVSETERFIRARAVMATTPNADFSVDVYLLPDSERPVTQAIASEFQV